MLGHLLYQVQKKMILKKMVLGFPKQNIYEFTALTQHVKSIHLANDNFNRINRSNK